MYENRLSFREPIPEIFDAARMLDAAVSAYQNGHKLLASELVEAAKIPSVGQWGYSIWGWKVCMSSRTPFSLANPIPQNKSALP